MEDKIWKPFEDFFSNKEPMPTQEEMQALFPSLVVVKTSGQINSYLLSKNNKIKGKRIDLDFSRQKEITIRLPKEDSQTAASWKEKTIYSCEEFSEIKGLLINFLLCDTKKIPELKTWKNKNY